MLKRRLIVENITNPEAKAKAGQPTRPIEKNDLE
jgi:hypothetical protein